jgi:hypothetical protein
MFSLRLRKLNRQVNPCDLCIHNSECAERRGACAEFKTLDMIRREIIDINDAYKAKTSTRTKDGDKDD